MLLLALAICSDPSIQRGPSVSQAEHAHPNCRPILFDETHSSFENPSPSVKRRDGSTIGIRQEESTWEVPYLNAVSGTVPGTDASRFWRFGKSTLLVQRAANTAVSLFSGRITIQLPFADLFLQDCEREQQFASMLGSPGNPQLTGTLLQQNDTPAETLQDQSDEKTRAEGRQNLMTRPRARSSWVQS